MGSLSSVLKQRRQELGLTLLQIAETVGVTEATVQRWESGNIKNIRLEKVGKLAEVLQVSPAALMGWAEPSEEKQPASGRGELSPSEEDLIHLFRLLPDDLKAGILAQIKAVLEQRGLLPPQ